jgi:iron complex outermembrane receptor protein
MRNRAISILLAGTALAMGSQAFAQDAAQQGAEDVDDGGIVVTGTRIVRDGYTAPTPVTVATMDELVKATPTNIPDALNKLPQFQNSLSPGKSASNFSAVPIHGNILNLRGLGTPTANPKGPLRTLVLFDGVRVAPTTYLGTIDTNVIPNLLISRVDVVTGGASAAWGSDAVAGVVNFILDKDFTGIKGVAQAGISGRGDAGNQRLGLAWGTGFGDDRGHVLLSAEFYNNEGLRRNQRKYGRAGYAYVGSTVGCTAPAGSTACSPGGSLNPLTIGTDVRIASASEYGKLFAAGNAFNNFKVNANGSLSPFVNGATTGTGGIQIGGDGYRIPDRTTAIAPFKTYQGFGRVDYDVSDGVNVFAQVALSRSDLAYDALANSLVQGNPTVTIYKGNPYLPAAIAATLADGGSIGFNGYWANDQRTDVRERTDFWQATFGVDAELGPFKFNANYSHGDSKHKMAQSGIWDWKRLYAAVDVVNVNGTPTCRVLTDPTVASQYQGCLPLNLFGGSNAPINGQPAAYAWATGTSRYTARFKHDSISASLSGSLFELPAGPVDIVVGAEYRKQKLVLDSNADPALLDTAAERSAYFAGLRGVLGSSLNYWLTNVGTARGSLNVKEAFGEIAIPVLKDTPFFQELSLNGAIRYTDYSTSGSVTTWKVGGTWKPVEDLLFRTTYSRDIRAPNLYELFRGDTSGLSIVLDPVTGLNQNAATVSGGNRDLKPEVAKTLTIGGVISPRFMPGFSLSVDYYRISLKGAIDALTSQQILNNCAQFGAGTPECALISRPSANAFPTLIRITEANISFLKTAGFDIDASYRTAIGEKSNLGIRLYANYLSKFETQLYAGQPVIHYAGANVVGSNPVSYPRWRGSLSVDFNSGPFGVAISEQYVGKMGRFLNAAAPLLSNFVNPGVKAVRLYRPDADLHRTAG